MEAIHIEGNMKNPTVNFNAEQGVVELEGRSIPEDSIAFYDPLLEWLDKYGENPCPETRVNIKLIYFNTSSSKCILDVFKKVDAIHNEGKSQVTVYWYYEEDDEDMEEAGEDYREILNLPFELVEVEA